MRELSLYKQNLQYKAKLYEKEVAGISEDIIDNFADKVKELTFNVTTKLITQFFSKKEK
jgi:hypothetical protein